MSKDVNMEKDTKLVNNYMAFRPPLEQWIEEDREKKWKEAEAAGTISNIVKKKFQPEFYIPTIGLCVGAGILGYRMSKLKHHRQVGELPNYLIYTRLAVQGTVVLSFVAFAAIQTGRFLSKKYGDK